MENLDGFTPDQLRAIADEMEAKQSAGITAEEHESRLIAIRGGKAESPEHVPEKMREDSANKPGYINHVEVEGIPLDIDMRRVKDLRTLRLVAEVQKGGSDSLAATLELADFVLGDQREKVERAVTDDDGFIDAVKYTDVFTKLFEAVGAKN